MDQQTITLHDGSVVGVRPPTASDFDALLGFLRSLSLESRRLRFFSPACDLEAAARWAASADGIDRVGLLATDESDRIVGHAAWEKSEEGTAEVAVEVAEDHRHLGLASELLRRVAHEAQRLGIDHLVAEVLPDNLDMLAVFRDEFGASERFVMGEVDVEFSSSAWSGETAPPPSPVGVPLESGVVGQEG